MPWPKHIKIHDLRHTHATLMLNMADVHPKVVSERLGHANIGITLDIYSHVLPGLQEAAAEKFDRIFEGDIGGNSEANVSKMLVNSEDLASKPYRSRTCDTLIKSQVDIRNKIRLTTYLKHLKPFSGLLSIIPHLRSNCQYFVRKTRHALINSVDQNASHKTRF